MPFAKSFDAVSILFAIVALIATFLSYLVYNKTYWKRKGVPYLKPNLLLGNYTDLIIGRKPTGQFAADLHKQGNGHRFVGIWTLQTPSILVRDPVIIKDILVKDFNFFCDRYSGGKGTFDVMGRSNLFFVDNPHWKYLRTKMTPAFTGVKLKKLANLMGKVGENMSNYIREKVGKDGAVLELKDICNRYGIDVVTSCAFGIESNAIRDEKCPFGNAGKLLFDGTFRRNFETTAYIMIPSFINIFRVEFFGICTKFFRQAFWESIHHREQSGEKRGDIIDSLLEIRESAKDGEFDFKEDRLVSQAAILFAAGFETSGTTLSYILYHLALEPEIQERARSEAFNVKEKYGDITYESLSELTYIDMVIKEVLRLNPPMPILNRICRGDYKMADSDVVLRAGTPVFISMLGLHMDPEYFREPEKFDPERFSEERKGDIKPFTYMPFGEGPRICIGMRFAMVSLKLIITRILTNFRVERCPRTQVPIKLVPGTVVMTPERGVELRVVPLKV